MLLESHGVASRASSIVMASLRSKAAPLAVGSVPWLSEERASAVQFIDQEVEEFTFAVRNEMDWLNEHLGEVFDENRVWNVAELMKTPGKLRGKTPRTARKRNALETRAVRPLQPECFSRANTAIASHRSVCYQSTEYTKSITQHLTSETSLAFPRR